MVCSGEWRRRDPWRRGCVQTWDVTANGEALFLKRGGIWLKAMAWRAEEVLERVETLRSRELQRTSERVPCVHRVNTPREGEVGTERFGASGTSEDARTLWIDWDNQGERYKPWRTVCQ